MTDRAVHVVCIKWGAKYPGEYVNRLAHAVADHLPVPHRFVCLTDMPDGLDPSIHVAPIPAFPLDRALWGAGMWPKLCFFDDAMFPAGDVVLFLDLDVVILNDLSPFVELVAREGGLRIIREWHPSLVRLLPVAWRPDRGGNSSVVGWIAGEQGHLLDRFTRDPDAARAGWRNDQAFITAHATGRAYWPYDWCASFKRHCVWYWPMNIVMTKAARPDWARIVVFHGKPDPVDLVGEDPDARWGARRKFGFGPVEWVQSYWRRYAR